MDVPESRKVDWGGRLWLIALIAVVSTALIVLILWPRPLVWTSPPPTEAPYTPRPGLWAIPTVPPPAPSPTPESNLGLTLLAG